MFLASVGLHSYWGVGEPSLFVFPHGWFRSCSPSLARLFLLGFAGFPHAELSLPFVHWRGRIPCISAELSQWEPSLGCPRSILLLETKGFPAGQVSQVEFVAMQTCQLLSRFWQCKCIWPVKTLSASNSFTSLQAVIRKKRMRQMQVKESLKLSVLLWKRQQECKLPPGSTCWWV